MPVVAMTREMGLQGKDIAIGLAEQLDLNIAHHHLLEHGVSRKLDVAESDVLWRLEGRTSMRERWALPGRNLDQMSVCEVLELAERGNVIIRGGGSTQLLGAVGHVLCVRMCAPLDHRNAT